MTLLELKLDVLAFEELKAGIQDINRLMRETICSHRVLEELLHISEVLFENVNIEA